LGQPGPFPQYASTRDSTQGATGERRAGTPETTSLNAECYDAGRMRRLRPTSAVLATAIVVLQVGKAFDVTPLSRMVNVNGAHLEYLDWGGDGPPMVFLAGLSDTPYIYDDLAPEFTSNYHCYGLTRRAHGQSETTAEGYKLDELVGDIASFLEILGLTNVILVGHSFGGIEVVRFAELYPAAMRSAIILDIAYDDEGPSAELISRTRNTVQELFMPPQQRRVSFDAYRKYLQFIHGAWSAASEANLRQQIIEGPDRTITPRMPPSVSAKIIDGANLRQTRIDIPALFIFAINPIADSANGLAVSGALKKQIESADKAMEVVRKAQIEAVRRDSPQARIVVLEHTSHRCFIQKKDRVIDEMRRFLR
jgi:non-heme chloroperoxidase